MVHWMPTWKKELPMTNPRGSKPASSTIRNSFTVRSLVKSRGGPPALPRISSRRRCACSGIRRTSATSSLIRSSSMGRFPFLHPATCNPKRPKRTRKRERAKARSGLAELAGAARSAPYLLPDFAFSPFRVFAFSSDRFASAFKAGADAGGEQVDDLLAGFGPGEDEVRELAGRLGVETIVREHVAAVPGDGALQVAAALDGLAEHAPQDALVRRHVQEQLQVQQRPEGGLAEDQVSFHDQEA